MPFLGDEHEYLQNTSAARAPAPDPKAIGSPHAQSCYERDITLPRAPYLAAITSQGVDVLYVITGRYTSYQPEEEMASVGNGQLIEK